MQPGAANTNSIADCTRLSRFASAAPPGIVCTAPEIAATVSVGSWPAASSRLISATSAAAAMHVLAGTYPGRKKLNTVGARSGLWPRPVAGSDVLPTAQVRAPGTIVVEHGCHPGHIDRAGIAGHQPLDQLAAEEGRHIRVGTDRVQRLAGGGAAGDGGSQEVLGAGLVMARHLHQRAIRLK